eukprot:g1351.t1
MPLLYNESTICEGGMCEKGNFPYERILPAQPGYQWDDAGGYCGSWAMQRAILTKGAYISEQQVRNHTSQCTPAGGEHDHEILSCNIEEAFNNLKIEFEGFDYVNEPRPQQDAYAKWIKKQLVAGFPVTWMIMWAGQSYPIYNLQPPAGMYGHVEPVIGIQSNHPLDDPTVYDDDTLVHFTDGGSSPVYRILSTMPGEWAGPGHKAKCRHGLKEYRYCMASYAFGWAVKGLADKNKQGLPTSLHIEPSLREPDTRSGAKPTPIHGTLTVTELTVGSSYEIYRWDTVEDAFTYTDSYKKSSFKATNTSYVFADAETFQSNGNTYYTCVQAA